MGDLTALTPKKAKADWRPIFLKALADYGNVSAAARTAGVTRQAAYLARKSIRFATDWDAAIDVAVDGLEHAAWHRASTTSDTLLIFLLKAHRPSLYRETTRHEVTGKDGGPLTFTIRLKDTADDDGE